MIPPVFKFPQPAELDLTLVIVSFNTREILLRCLGTIKSYTEDISYEVIVVDNASEDGTVDAVVENFPDVHLITNPDNRGFSAANNQGIIASKGQKMKKKKKKKKSNKKDNWTQKDLGGDSKSEFSPCVGLF